MSSDDTGWLTDAVESGREAVREFTSFLGIQREAFVCPACQVACEETHVFNPQTAAFDGGACPAWYCEKCQTHYIRDVDDETHTLDLYER